MTPTSIGQAVILAAGRGSRTGFDYPKCLHEVAGKPIVGWTLDALRRMDIREVLVVGGFRSDLLHALDLQVRENDRWSGTNMVRSLMRADDWLRRAPTLVVYGDGAYGPTALATVLRQYGGGIGVPVDRLWHDLWQRRFADPLSDAETLVTRDGRIVAIGARPRSLEEVEGQFMGLLAMSPAGWTRIVDEIERIECSEGSTTVDRLDCTSLLARLIDRGVALDCINVQGGWAEFDSRDDCIAIERGLDEPGFTHDFRR